MSMLYAAIPIFKVKQRRPMLDNTDVRVIAILDLSLFTSSYNRIERA